MTRAHVIESGNGEDDLDAVHVYNGRKGQSEVSSKHLIITSCFKSSKVDTIFVLFLNPLVSQHVHVILLLDQLSRIFKL